MIYIDSTRKRFLLLGTCFHKFNSPIKKFHHRFFLFLFLLSIIELIKLGILICFIWKSLHWIWKMLNHIECWVKESVSILLLCPQLLCSNLKPLAGNCSSLDCNVYGVCDLGKYHYISRHHKITVITTQHCSD